jgi:hypothetical protein
MPISLVKTKLEVNVGKTEVPLVSKTVLKSSKSSA